MRLLEFIIIVLLLVIVAGLAYDDLGQRSLLTASAKKSKDDEVALVNAQTKQCQDQSEKAVQAGISIGLLSRPTLRKSPKVQPLIMGPALEKALQ